MKDDEGEVTQYKFGWMKEERWMKYGEGEKVKLCKGAFRKYEKGSDVKMY